MRLVRIFLFIAFVLFAGGAFGQIHADSTRLADSLQVADSLRRLDSLQADSLSRVPPPLRDTLRPVLQFPFTSDTFLYRNRLYFRFTNPVRYTISERHWQGKDALFYTVVGLLIVFALVKNSFRRYLSDLFGSYFRTTLRQRQVKEQLLQQPLPSLLYNAFFVLSAAVFCSLLLEHFLLAEDIPFWLLAVYCAAALIVIYGGKFLLLKFFGWVFQLREATDTYIFVIFSTNKILGILLLPFVVLLAFTGGRVNAAAVTLSLVVVAGMFAYRFFLSYISIQRQVRLNLFHFLLYLAAFEIVPVLLINKLLFLILREIY